MNGRIMLNPFMEVIKMMLKSCLIIGIAAFSVISCTKTEYVNESEWYFINNTNKTIQVTYGDGSFINDEKSFLLSPNKTYSFIISSDSTRPDLSADDYDSPYSFHGATIKIYGVGTSFFPGRDSQEYNGQLQSICNIDNYATFKCAMNHYRFTYEFKDDL